MRTPAPRAVPRPSILLPVASALGLAVSCLYLPPVRHSAGDSTLRRAQAEAKSREALEYEIGRADVIRTRAIWVHDWEQSYGYFIAGYSGSELTGERHRVLARFDGDAVASLEVAAPPTVAAAAPEGMVLEGCAGDDERRAVIALAAAGGTIAAIDTRGGLCVWRDLAPEGRLVVPVVGREKKPKLSVDGAVAVSSDGRRVAAASDLSVVVWDVADGRIVATVTRPRVSTWSRPPRVTSAAFSPDGARLAIAGPESLLVLEAGTWQVAWSVVKSPGFGALAFTSDGARLVVTDVSGQLFDYDAATGELLARVSERRSTLPDLVPLAVWAGRVPARRALVAGQAALETWDLGALERRFESTGAAVAILEDEEVPELSDARLMPLPALPRKVHLQWPPIAPCGRSVALTPDGTLLAEQLCQEVRLFRLPALELVAAYDGSPPPPPPSSPLSDAGSAGSDGDAPSLPSVTHRHPRPGPVAFTPDGRRLLQAIGADIIVRDLPDAVRR